MEDQKPTKKHIQKLKDIYKKLNPTGDKKEISYISNLRNLIKDLEDNLSFQKLVFENVNNLEIINQPKT